MLGGAAKFQRENILGAIATAYVQGMRYDDIRAGLLSFFPSPSLTPGRLNMMRVEKGRVLVDYAHNPAAIAGLMDFIRNLDATKRIGVITAPGDRRDEDLHHVGRLGAGLDFVIVKEDRYRRGREPGETALHIKQGLHEVGIPDSSIEVIFDELEAVKCALDKMEDNDLVVVLADDVQSVLNYVRDHARDGAH
jgi:cyanophycin synthetase